MKIYHTTWVYGSREEHDILGECVQILPKTFLILAKIMPIEDAHGKRQFQHRFIGSQMQFYTMAKPTSEIVQEETQEKKKLKMSQN